MQMTLTLGQVSVHASIVNEIEKLLLDVNLDVNNTVKKGENER